jgi:hypothetical protein
MSLANVTENAILNLIFSATTWANYAINATSSPETNIVVALHTADPGEAGAQNTTETAYTSYARVNVARGAGWTTSTAGSVSPVATISFPIGTTGTSDTVTYFSTGKSGGGASPILFSGVVSPSITTGAGITPQLSTSTVVTLD